MGGRAARHADSSDCQVGDPYPALGTACRGFSTVELNTGCAGATESGEAFIRVRSTDSTCRTYTLSTFIR